MKNRKWFERNHKILLAFSILVVCLAVVSTSCYMPCNIPRKAPQGVFGGTPRVYGETTLAYQNTNYDQECTSRMYDPDNLRSD